MNKLFLKKPNTTHEKQYKEMLKDWHTTNEDLIPFVMKIDCNDFNKFICILNKLQTDIIKCSIFFLTTELGEIVGMTHIRHDFNNNECGHIAYGIMPSMRNRGYATELLRLAIIETRKLGIMDIIVTCSSNNIYSEKVILKNNGIFYMEKEIEGSKTKYFYIKK